MAGIYTPHHHPHPPSLPLSISLSVAVWMRLLLVMSMLTVSFIMAHPVSLSESVPTSPDLFLSALITSDQDPDTASVVCVWEGASEDGGVCADIQTSLS